MAIVSEVLQDTSVLLLYRSSLRHNPVAAYTTSSDSFFNSSTECFASWGLPYFIVVPLISLYPWHSVFACDSCICCLIANKKKHDKGTLDQNKIFSKNFIYKT